MNLLRPPSNPAVESSSLNITIQGFIVHHQNLARVDEKSALTHLSQLEGSGTREGAPEVHRGQKVCTTGAFVLVLIHKLSTRADARWRLGRQREVELFEQEFVIGFWMGVAA